MNFCLLLPVLWLLPLAGLAPASGPPPVAVSITLTGLRAGKGAVVFRCYHRPDQFLQTAYLQQTQLASRATLTLAAELPAGTYALAAFQDLDGNGELNLNWLRIPTEPVGFGNNFQPRFSKPTFAECAVAVSTQQHTFTIALK